ncbi:MAG: translation initiation factor IF-3 [Candidatus Marinimicrobia bacterium]|nr:translation initiation factor IF-3 [Candidatus Neomarinimicrobiota bacterium]
MKKYKVYAKEEELRINDEIDTPEVLLVDENGEQAGLVPVQEALVRAENADLDLVEVAPNAKPPVCKLMDYSKYKYEKAKKAKEAKKKQKIIQNKEVRFRPNIEDHDLKTKVSKAREFLDDGDRVKITIMFRGREMAYLDRGPLLMTKIMSHLGEDVHMEYKPTMEGRFLTTVVTLKK